MSQSEQKEKTHLIFDGEKVVISSDLVGVFQFLMEIDKEVESFLGFEKKLGSIRKQYLETINLIQFLAKKLQDNNIDFKFDLSEKPETIADKLKLHLPTRSQMIVLFSSLETLFCLNIAYQNKTDNDNSIRKAAMDSKVVKKFLNSYCLTDKNEWYKENKERFHVSAKQLRDFRNSLIHFFSVSSDISIVPSVLASKARKLEKLLKEKGKKNVAFISPEDLHSLVGKAAMLMVKEWSNDSLHDPIEFKERVLSVESVIKKNGVILVENKQLNL